MLGEEVFIDAGLVIEALQVAGGNEVDEVAIALLVFAEQDQVVIAIGVGPGFVALLGNIDLAADDGLDAGGLAGIEELDSAEEVAVIGHGDGGHILLGADFHELGDFASPVKHGVIGVAVEVDEGFIGHI
jgi:hypothetical protein